jgi:hypothetical protein
MARTHRATGRTRKNWWPISKGISHCGAGCTLGDIVGEWIVYLTAWSIAIFANPAANSLMAMFVADFVLAWTFGIAFQVLLDRPDARGHRPAAGQLGGDQGRHPVDYLLPARPVRCTALYHLVFFKPRSPSPAPPIGS